VEANYHCPAIEGALFEGIPGSVPRAVEVATFQAIEQASFLASFLAPLKWNDLHKLYKEQQHQ